MAQAMSKFIQIAWDFQVFLYANHIYYHCTKEGLESPLPDDVYDAIVRVLENNYEQLPKWFTDGIPKGSIKSAAHSIELEPEEAIEAVAWARGIMKIKNGEE